MNSNTPAAELTARHGVAILDKLDTAVLVTDREQAAVYVNPKCRDMLQLTSRQCVGKIPWESLQRLRRTLRAGETCEFRLQTTALDAGLWLHVFTRIDLTIPQSDSGKAGLLTVCCVCHRARVLADEWVEIEPRELMRLAGRVTHSYCPVCAQATREEFQRLRRQRSVNGK